MPYYQTKPKKVEAFKLSVMITLDATIENIGDIGDWIISDADGHLSVVDDKDFNNIYEKVTE